MKRRTMGKAIVLAAMAVLAAAAHGEVVATARSPEGKFPEFRVALDAVGAPVAVANFMGLVDGSQAWLDPVTGGVRGGADDAFYTGMVFDWHAGSVLRGGLKEKERKGIVEHTGGPGYTIRSEVGASGWNEVKEGTLALVERIQTLDGALIGDSFAGWFGGAEVDVMHGGGAELGLFLTNGVVPWTVFGHVPEQDKAGLRGLAEAVGRGATEVRWAVDASGATAAELSALAAARAELPMVHGCATRLTAAGPEWEWSGKSRLWYSLSTNLLSGWHPLPLWNEGDEPSTMDVPWANLGWKEEDETYVVLDGPQGFASFAEVEYPAMAGEPLAGKWTIQVEHTGQTMQYWLDFNGAWGGGTGIWAKVEGTNVTEVGNVSGAFAARETGNSICVRFFRGMTIQYYWFGVEKEGDTGGRFQSVQIEVGEGGLEEKDAGTYEWVAGWGKEAETHAAMAGQRRAVLCPSDRRPLPGGRATRTGTLVFERPE